LGKGNPQLRCKYTYSGDVVSSATSAKYGQQYTFGAATSNGTTGVNV
jgi:hypothetical protein